MLKSLKKPVGQKQGSCLYVHCCYGLADWGALGTVEGTATDDIAGAATNSTECRVRW